MRPVCLLSCAALFALISCSPGPAEPSRPGASGAPAATPSEPAPAGEPARTPTGTPETPAGVVVEPRPTPGSEAPSEQPAAGEAVECTPDKRKGGRCTREFRAVCGSYADNTSKTFSNPCVACSDEKVVRYVPEACADAK